MCMYNPIWQAAPLSADFLNSEQALAIQKSCTISHCSKLTAEAQRIWLAALHFLHLHRAAHAHIFLPGWGHMRAISLAMTKLAALCTNWNLGNTVPAPGDTATLKSVELNQNTTSPVITGSHTPSHWGTAHFPFSEKSYQAASISSTKFCSLLGRSQGCECKAQDVISCPSWKRKLQCKR